MFAVLFIQLKLRPGITEFFNILSCYWGQYVWSDFVLQFFLGGGILSRGIMSRIRSAYTLQMLLEATW